MQVQPISGEGYGVFYIAANDVYLRWLHINDDVGMTAKAVCGAVVDPPNLRFGRRKGGRGPSAFVSCPAGPDEIAWFQYRRGWVLKRKAREPARSYLRHID